MKSLLSSFLLAVRLSAPAFAQTDYTWTGATSSDWATASNWSPASVPTSGDRVLIGSTSNPPVLDANRTVLRIKQTANTLDLNTYTLTITGSALFLGGTVTDGRVLQTGGSTDSTQFYNVTMNCKVNVESVLLRVNGSTFADSTRISLKGTLNGSYGGSNDFDGPLELLVRDSPLLQMGLQGRDSINSSLSVVDSSSYAVYITAHYGGTVKLAQRHTGTMSLFGGNFAQDLTINAKSGSGGLRFYGPHTIAAGKTIRVGSQGYLATTLYFEKLKLLGTEPFVLDNLGSTTDATIYLSDIEVPFSSSSGYFIRMGQSKFHSTVDVSAKMSLCDRSRFLEDVNLTRDGGINFGQGGSRFYKDVTITHAVGSNATYYGNYHPDTVMGDLTINNYATGYIIWAYAQTSRLYGNVTLNAVNGPIYMGNTTNGRITMCGTGDQVWTANTSLTNGITHHDFRIDKPSGDVLLRGNAEIVNSLQLVKGLIRPRSGNYVRLRDNATVSGASDSSHVVGPVRKLGNDTFTYPVGRSGIYRPIAISAPSTTTAEFRAEYFDTDSDPLYAHASRDASLHYLNHDEHWTLDRLATTNTVYVTLGWNGVDCGLPDTDSLKVAAWNGTTWKDLGHGTITGNTTTGTVTTSAASTVYGPYVLANWTDVTADAGPDRVIEAGDTATIGIMDNTPAWLYAWTPATYVLDDDSATTRAWPTITTDYVLEVEAETGCSATDTMTVFITTIPESEGTSSLDFAVNNGQLIDTDGNLRPDIGIYSHEASPALYCGDNRLSFVQTKADNTSFGIDTIARVDIGFEETYTEAAPLGMGLNPHVYNYFLAHCPEGVTMVPSYNRVVYPQLYEYTDLHVSGNNSWMKFEFIIHPGGDPEDILMTFEGAEDVELIEETGTLVVTSSIGTYVFNRPAALKIDEEGEVTELGWQPDWSLSVEGDTVRFTDIGEYDEEEILVLRLGEEPMLFGGGVDFNNVWSTYIGTSGVYEQGRDVETDSEGNLYWVGGVSTRHFPISAGAIQPLFGSVAYPGSMGVRDALICKFSPEGVRLISTFYGGWFDDFGTNIEIDATNSRLVMLGGTQSDDYPTTAGSFQPVISNLGTGLLDLVLTVFNLQLSEVFWSTHYGGTDEDFVVGGEHMVLDDASNIILGISRVSDDIPIVPMIGAYNQSTLSTQASQTGLIAQFDSDGNLDWSTFFPGFIGSIEFAQDELYVVGAVSLDPDPNTCGPPASGGFVLCDNGGFYQDYQSSSTLDGFLCKFSEEREVVWSTYVGGAPLADIALQGRNIYVVGHSSTDGDAESSEPPCSEPAVGETVACDADGTFYLDHQGNSDMFLAKFDRLTSNLLWATLYGGEGYDGASKVEIDTDGRVFVAGQSNHSSFPTVDYGNNFYYEENCSDLSGTEATLDPVVLMIVGNTVEWATFYGGGLEVPDLFGIDQEYIMGMTTHDNSRMYITGITPSPAYPYRCDPILYPNQYCRQTSLHSELQDGFITLFKTDGSNTVGINDVQPAASNLSQCVVYPNPNTGLLKMDLVMDNTFDLQIRIVDLTGRKMIQRDVVAIKGGFSVELDVHELNQGMYLVSMNGADQRWTCRFIKQ